MAQLPERDNFQTAEFVAPKAAMQGKTESVLAPSHEGDLDGFAVQEIRFAVSYNGFSESLDSSHTVNAGIINPYDGGILLSQFLPELGTLREPTLDFDVEEYVVAPQAPNLSALSQEPVDTPAQPKEVPTRIAA